MRYSKVFGKTVKDISVDIKLKSHQFLLMGGFIRESVAGRYYFLPLGMKVNDKIMKIVEEEMNKAGAQKMITPILHPIELWQETNRASSVGFELMQVKDQRGAGFALGGTAEEMMVDVVRKFNLSYKDLPFNIYQFSTKFRDEKRARGGLLRTREFVMKDAYSFHADSDDFQKEYETMAETYKTIFEKVGLKTFKIEADNGYIGGEYCHEFVVECESGESRFLLEVDGQYAAHEEVARFLREDKNIDEEMKDMKIIEADRGPTIKDGAKFYNEPSFKQIKTILYIDENKEPFLVCLRGDLEISDIKLQKVIGKKFRIGTKEEIAELGSVYGFVSPLKLKIKKIGDTSLKTVKNFCTGADEEKKDTINVNYGRDFVVDIMGDIALAPDDALSENGKKMYSAKGIEVGNIFQLGTHYSSRMAKACFTDRDGAEKPFYMGCYGIGIGRTLATVVEMHNDEKGIIWPKSIAPFDYHLVVLGEEKEVKDEAENIYQEMLKNDLDVLFDDREESIGRKLNDADLIGIPNRIIVSKRSLENKSVEFKERTSKESKLIAVSDLIKELKEA